VALEEAGAHRQSLQASIQAMGTVKWYNATKGFGFIIMDSGGREIFVHATVLDRSSIAGLREGQRVFVEVVCPIGLVIRAGAHWE
jgi:CspA family cold shock protein